MRIQTRILLNFIASLTISVLIVLIIFSSLRKLDHEAARDRVYDEIRKKTYALTLLTARLSNEPDPGRIRQVREVRTSLEGILGTLTPSDAREKSLVRNMRTNAASLGESLEQLIAISVVPISAVQSERHDVLFSQLLMKTQYISDDTQRLIAIGEIRMASSRRNAVLLAVALILSLLLVNSAISFFIGRQILRFQEDLRLALAKAEEGDRLLSAFMEHAPEGIGMVDADLNPTRVSRDSKDRLLGFPFPGPAWGETGAQREVFHADGKTPMAFEELPLVRAVRRGDVVKDVEIVQSDARGGRMSLLSSAGPIREADGRIVGGIIVTRDITNRRQAEEAMLASEERLKALLGEKEVLLKEVHHRVKNNLQVISSLVALQADELDDPSLRALFQDVNNRVRSIAMVHEKLYNSEDLAQIEFSDYAQGLLDYLWRANEMGGTGIRLVTDMASMYIPVTAAVPCGLILNELVSNALKHAFPGRTHGDVTVFLRGGGGEPITLCVRDNGTGLPPGFELSQCRSLGLRLVQMLAVQLHGTVEVEKGSGTGFAITFGGPKA